MTRADRLCFVGRFPERYAQYILALEKDKHRGLAAEVMAYKYILPSLGCDPIAGRSAIVKSTDQVPFDVLAKWDDEFWLVEVKTGRATPNQVQRGRMARLCDLLKERGCYVTPLLLQVNLTSIGFELLDYPSTQKSPKGNDGNLPGVADRVAAWIEQST